MWVSRSLFFFFNDTATTEIYTLSLHDALPILFRWEHCCRVASTPAWFAGPSPSWAAIFALSRSERRVILTMKRSEEHTSELQSPCNLVCRPLLEKKKKAYHHSPTVVSLSRLSS